MKTIITILMLATLSLHAQRISGLNNTNVAVGTNLLPIVVNPNGANGTRNINVANLFSNRTHAGWSWFEGPLTNNSTSYGNTNGIVLRGTNVISASSALGEMGLHLFTDGTNLLGVFQNKAGTRTTNKFTMSAWP